MSSYEYTDRDGDKLTVNSNSPAGFISIRVTQDGDGMSAYVLNSDAPAVAAELLKAAGQESVIVPKSSEPILAHGNGTISCGQASTGRASAPASLRDKAADYIALAEYIEGLSAREAAEKAETEAAEKKLQERRDALAAEFAETWGLSTRAYMNCDGPLRTAITRIINLQDGK